MKKITALKQQKRKADRVSVYLDGEFAFGLGLEAVMLFGLKVGLELEEEMVTKLIDEGEYGKLYNGALTLISRRPRSEKEIVDWMKRKEAGDLIVERIVAKLKEIGMLNDEQFATWWVEQRQEFKPRGARALTQELQQKGIDRGIIESVVSSLGNQTAAIRQLAEKKFRQVQRDEPRKQKEKVVAFLMRKGYTWGEIKGVIDELWDGTYT